MLTPSTPIGSGPPGSKTPAAKCQLDVSEQGQEMPKRKRPRPKVNQALWKNFLEKPDNPDNAICQILFKKTVNLVVPKLSNRMEVPVA
jgi:hypothetical protein